MGSLDVLLHNAMIDVTIAISQAVAAEARSLRINRIDQIDNGIPISLFRSISPQPSGSLGKIISVARLFPEKKGQDILIMAIKHCVDRGLDVDCTLVGSPMPGDSHTLPALQALVSTLQLTSRVHFLTGRSDVPALLGNANIFVLPSRYEGFGLALVEAMAAGLPVIASNIDGPAGIIADGMDGLLFEPGSDEQLAGKIATLIHSPAVAEKLRTNGRATASKYDISTMRDRYIEIYKRLADR
jgi:glycosyltransferase involved in cell wall biosynthesis